MGVPEQACILLIDDNEDDIVLARRALAQAQILNPLYVLRDGEEAMAYLQGAGKYADRSEFPLPDLVLLDLKMPRMDGFELLHWVRHQPALRALRIVVLTSSEEIYDVNRAYGMGANSFLVKPFDFEDYVGLARTLGSFWFGYTLAPKLDQAAQQKGNTPHR